jgi:hypothetical protein
MLRKASRQAQPASMGCSAEPHQVPLVPPAGPDPAGAQPVVHQQPQQPGGSIHPSCSPTAAAGACMGQFLIFYCSEHTSSVCCLVYYVAAAGQLPWEVATVPQLPPGATTAHASRC